MFEMTSQRRYQRTIKNLAGGGVAGYKSLGLGGGVQFCGRDLFSLQGSVLILHDIKLAKLNTSFMRTFLKICQVIYFSWFKLTIEQN